jgi:hypothetical protein
MILPRAFPSVILVGMLMAGCQSRDAGLPPSPPAAPAAQNTAAVAESTEPEPQPVDMGARGSRPVVFQRVIISMASGATIGKVTGGLLNIQWQTLKAVPGEGAKQFVYVGREELRKAKYTLPGDDNQLFGEEESPKARYELGAQITWIQLDIHAQAGWTQPTIESNGAISVEWQVFDSEAKKVIFKRSMDTGFHNRTKGTSGEPPMFAMFRLNVRQLLADPGFVSFMQPDQPDSKPAESHAAPQVAAPSG